MQFGQWYFSWIILPGLITCHKGESRHKYLRRNYPHLHCERRGTITHSICDTIWDNYVRCVNARRLMQENSSSCTPSKHIRQKVMQPAPTPMEPLPPLTELASSTMESHHQLMEPSPMASSTERTDVGSPQTSTGIPNTLIQSANYPYWVWIVVMGAISSTVIITCLVVLLALYAVQRFKRQILLTQADRTEFFEGTTSKNTEVSRHNSDTQQDAYIMMKYNTDKFEIAKNEFQFGDAEKKCILGEGNFGFVYRVRVTRFESEVAVKTPRNGCSRQAIKSLLYEIKIMSYVGDHDNVIKFLGAYTKEIKTGVLFIATELCTMGSLQAHLQKMGRNTKDNLVYIIPQLFRFCFEIASGMQFISEKGVIHGDLAARNVLLDSNSVCKITDFGLSKKLYQYQVYIKKHQEELPWRWLAVETLKRQEFSTKSDVWSYGVTLWEIFSYGVHPYPGLSWTLDFVELLDSGMRLTKPKNAPHNVYNKMLDCWNSCPNSRPNFEELANFFSTLMRDSNYSNSV